MSDAEIIAGLRAENANLKAVNDQLIADNRKAWSLLEEARKDAERLKTLLPHLSLSHGEIREDREVVPDTWKIAWETAPLDVWLRDDTMSALRAGIDALDAAKVLSP